MVSRFAALLALGGFAAAHPPMHQIAVEVESASVHHTNTHGLSRRDVEPCQVLSEAYEAAVADTAPGGPILLDVLPSVGIACLKSVPLNIGKNEELLDYIEPFVQIQSTLDILANPPDEYLVPGVDVLGGLDKIRTKLLSKMYDYKYQNQYEFMTDLRSLFAAASDGHFDYPPALLTIFYYTQRQIKFYSLSKDGVALPLIFDFYDVGRGNNGTLDYRPSAVHSVDGIPVFEYLENLAVNSTGNYQDPDARFNGLHYNLARVAAASGGSSTARAFEIPDYHNITFYNGTVNVWANGIYFPAGIDFSGIKNGQDVQNRFEIPPTASTSTQSIPATTEAPSSIVTSDATSTAEVLASTTTQTPAPSMTGYPNSSFISPYRNLGGFLLEGSDYDDVAVLSVLSFEPIGFDMATLNSSDFNLQSRDTIANFLNAAHRDGRTKIVIDMSANGGGYIALADQMYRLFFPNGNFTLFDRMRNTPGLKAMAEAGYDAFVGSGLIDNSGHAPVDINGKRIRTGEAWFGPDLVAGQNVSMAFHDDYSRPFDSSIDLYFNGEDPNHPPVIPEALFEPENILIVTDGTCASSCTIFTGLMTRGHPVRTLALGGRRNNYPMQAMGGVKGSQVSYNLDFINAVAQIKETHKGDKRALQILEEAKDVLPSSDSPPLLPVPAAAGGGQCNAHNGYPSFDINGYPCQFRYEAAHCRIYYTQRMTHDVTEIWRRAADVAWNGAKCAAGSSTNADGTIGDEAPTFNSAYRSTATGISGPGAL